MNRTAVEIVDIDGVTRTLDVKDVLAALDDGIIEDEAEDRGLRPEPETEEMTVADMIEALEDHGYEVAEESATDPADYVQAALRVALADPTTPREFRDLLFYVHGCIIP